MCQRNGVLLDREGLVLEETNAAIEDESSSG